MQTGPDSTESGPRTHEIPTTTGVPLLTSPQRSWHGRLVTALTATLTPPRT
ncbi:hypothetical protein ACWGE1_29940 [Streptomyces sp. NPDC054932]